MVQASAALRYSVVWWHVLNKQTDGNLRSGPSVGLSTVILPLVQFSSPRRRADVSVDLAGSKVLLLLLTAGGWGCASEPR